MIGRKPISARRLISVLCAYVSLSTAISGFQQIAFFGFPDGHVTAYENAVRLPLGFLYCLHLLFGIFYTAYVFVPAKLNIRMAVFILIFLAFSLCTALSTVVVPWYFLKGLNLDNGFGG